MRLGLLSSTILNIVSQLQSVKALYSPTIIQYSIFLSVLLINIIVFYRLIKADNEHIRVMKALESSENKYRTIFQSMHEGFALLEVIYDRNGKPEDYYIIEVNPELEAITGFDREVAVYKTFHDLLPHMNEENIEMVKNVALTGEPVKFEGYTKDFKKHLLVSVFKPEQDRIAVILSDVSQKKTAEELAQRQNLTFKALFKNSSDAIVLFDQNHKVTDINEKFTSLFGYFIDEIRGKEVDNVVASGQKLIEANQITSNLLEGHEVSLETVRFGADGQPRDVSVKGVPIILNDRIIGGYGIYADISERKNAEKEILYMNYHDQLTGLYNRRFFEEELKRLNIERNLPISVIMADVNGLKLINDAFGHAAGDRLLIKTAELIKNECRADEIIARLGGDEFVILLPKTNPEEAEKIIKRIKAASSGVRVQSMELSISFGWDTKTSDPQDINEMLKNAEDNMYRDKLFESPSIRGKTIQAIIKSLHEKNKREEQHSQRVSYLCEAIGIAMGQSESEVNELKTVGLLHDIGKIAIDEKILNKPGRLTIEEWNEIKRHPEIGYRILSSVNDMAELAEFVLAHHERWDGKGYPKGLIGEEISLQARIIMVADAYDAMTSERAYRKPLDEETVIAELRDNAGKQFDPEIVRIFVEKVMNKKSI
ncbi:MAG TPA: HD domain-containing phosphohydrolase [Patescibacteria group bacterium]|nr:HD domain-containing phosphohydrolase [Patescibacteria group bacterium]